MKKIIAILLSAILFLTAAASLAENGQNNQQSPAVSSQNGQQPPAGFGGDNGQEPPTKPDGDNGQEPPAKPDGDNGQQPPAGFGNGSNGQPEKLIDFEQLLEDGVIDQELYDAIMNYMKEHTPQRQTDEAAPGEDSDPPARPDGTSDENGGMENQLLKDLLNDGIITQEQYDVFVSVTASGNATSGSET